MHGGNALSHPYLECEIVDEMPCGSAFRIGARQIVNGNRCLAHQPNIFLSLKFGQQREKSAELGTETSFVLSDRIEKLLHRLLKGILRGRHVRVSIETRQSVEHMASTPGGDEAMAAAPP